MPVPLSGRTSPAQSDWDHWAGRIDRISGRFEEKGMDGYVIRSLHSLIMDYYTQHGRHDLPWRLTRDPYCIVVSEIMLQQTQVERVIPKYRTFVKVLPGFTALARAPLRKVLRLWQGLGYNRRALALHDLARVVVESYQGKVPDDMDTLRTLPGIGKATAGAICAYAYDQPVAFIETNIRAVYLFLCFSRRTMVRDRDIMPLIEKSVDGARPRDWYQALMDFGVFIKKHVSDLNKRSAGFKKQSRFQGSDRNIRGDLIRTLVESNEISLKKAALVIECTKKRLERIVQGLIMDGLIEQHGSNIRIITRRS